MKKNIRPLLFMLLLIVIVLFTIVSCGKPGLYNAKITKKLKWEGFKVEKITFDSVEKLPVTGHLLLPKEIKEGSPCIIAAHGLTSSSDEWMILDGYTKGGNLSRSLLENGYAIFAMNARFHGDRFPEDQGESSADKVRNLVTTYDMEFFYGTNDDYLRAIQYLKTRKELNPEKFGIIGYSNGGIFSLGLANRSEDLKVAVTCVPPISRINERTEAHNNIQRIKTKPVLMLMANNDDHYSTEDAEWLFNKLKTPTKDIRFYDSDHSLPVDYVNDAVQWFIKHL